MKNTSSNAMISHLFYKLLPVQVLIVAMGSINSIVDGIMAGQFVNSEAVAVIGLFYTVVGILSAVASVLLGGTSILCGRYMGSGDLSKTQGIFSLNITVSLLAGLLATGICFLCPDWIASALGAEGQMMEGLKTYTIGYAIGIIPMLMGKQLAAFLQLERQSKRSYGAIVGMIISNISLNLLFVVEWKMGTLGLALATSLSNWVYFLIMVPYYFTKKAQLRYQIHNIPWRELPQLVKIGFPGAMLAFCLAMRGMVVNLVLLTWSGQDGVSAMAAFNMVCGLFLALCLGACEVIRMLSSIFIGEEDRDALKSLVRLAFNRVLPMTAVVGVATMAASGLLSAIFFQDPASNVFILTRQIFLIYGACIPLVFLCNLPCNYLQASGHNIFVNVLSVFDGFLSMVIPSLILAPFFGAMGVWLAHPIGMMMTIILVPIYCYIFWRHWPRNFEEWIFLRPSFGVADCDRLEISVASSEDVTQTAVRVQAFCQEHGISPRIGYFSALCLEEMAGNVVQHGFRKDNRSHIVNCRVVITGNQVLLRIKDDCIPFDPMERAKMVSPEDPTKNIGVRMVCRLATEMTYQNMIGLNILTIRLTDENSKDGNAHHGT